MAREGFGKELGNNNGERWVEVRVCVEEVGWMGGGKPSRLGWPQLKTTEVVLVVSVTW